MNKRFEKTETVLVAVNEQGIFFGLYETPAATSPREAKHPADAYIIHPHDKTLQNIQPATYYFENSDRMRTWLKGFKMVAVKITTVAEIVS
jgi:hypothetical protein